MSLLKLSGKKSSPALVTKARKILQKIPSQNLILEAYLFGSAVDGKFTPDSDLDFLVVVETENEIRSLQKEVYQPRFADIAIDWIFKSRDEFLVRKDLGGVCFEAFHHGKRLK